MLRIGGLCSDSQFRILGLGTYCPFNVYNWRNVFSPFNVQNGRFVDEDGPPEMRNIQYDLSPEKMEKIWVGVINSLIGWYVRIGGQIN